MKIMVNVVILHCESWMMVDIMKSQIRGLNHNAEELPGILDFLNDQANDIQFSVIDSRCLMLKELIQMLITGKGMFTL